jgi:opacity protein-like surface antigen
MSAAALAADIAPVYKAPPPAVTTYSWTGWYIGGHAGYGWGDHDVTISHNDQAFFGPAFAAGATQVCTTQILTVSSAARRLVIIGKLALGYSVSKGIFRIRT